MIGRALMAKPRLLLLDEPSLGVAPKIVQDIARSIVAINRDEKVSVLLVEQNSRMALRVSHRAYAMATGSVALSGLSADLETDERVRISSRREFVGHAMQPEPSSRGATGRRRRPVATRRSRAAAERAFGRTPVSRGAMVHHPLDRPPRAFRAGGRSRSRIRPRVRDPTMRIHVINPNTTASMTQKIGVAARAAASPSVEVSAVNPEFGPPSIEGYYDEAFAVPGLLAEIARAADADAFVVACFDDTGLEAARCAANAPVVGIGEAAFHVASLVADKFSVVDHASAIDRADRAQPRQIWPCDALRPRPRRQRAGALEEPGSDARRTIEAEIGRALAEDGAEAIVLGCAGMTDLVRNLESKAGVPVLDGVACAVGLAEALARLAVRTSKRNTYASPLGKAYAGAFAKFSPR